MLLRAINEVAVHFESFRNIELWYQGMYFITIELTYQAPGSNPPKTVHAHPFAHTQNFHPNEQSKKFYDHQIVKTASIDDANSRFISKSFIVKYYEEEVEINDICHFRIETSLSDPRPELLMTTSLMFIDMSNKKPLDKMDGQEKQNLYKEAKMVKCNKFYLLNIIEGIHEFVPVVFDENYFCLANLSVHSICLDYRFRVNTLQLSEFSKLSYNDKMRMIESNNKLMADIFNGGRIGSYYHSILKELNQPDKISSLKKIENILVTDMKYCYSTLLYHYSTLFSKIITDNERKMYGNSIINPNALCLFEDTNQILKNVSQDPEQLFRKYRSKNPEEIVEKMIDETNMISLQLQKLWNCYIDLFKIAPHFAITCLETDYRAKKREFWTKLIYVNKVIKKNVFDSSSMDTKLVEKNLLGDKAKLRLGLQVQQEIFVQRRQQLPVMIYNVHYLEQDVLPKTKPGFRTQKKIEETDERENDEGIHLVVFVHGFQGNSFDMRLIKNYVSFLHPESMFLCSTSNEDLTDTDIFSMGERLATEVREFIKDNFPLNTLARISFIGHSLGGVIIRAALPRLLDFRQKFHCFMSFSSPHLGYGTNTSSVVEAGMWMLKKMNNSICLTQLSMSDSEIPEQTCLYKLSQAEGLEHFKHIYLFSSKQDAYAPFESARMEIRADFIGDPKKQLHCRMVKNALKFVKSGVLKRVNVLFDIAERSLDTLIGRTAHILFLQSQELMKAILYSEPELLA